MKVKFKATFFENTLCALILLIGAACAVAFIIGELFLMATDFYDRF